MRRLIVLFLLMLLFLSCGGGGGSGAQNGIPVAASDMDTKLKTNMVRSLQLVPNIESSLLFVMNPGIPMAQGVTVTPEFFPIQLHLPALTMATEMGSTKPP